MLSASVRGAGPSNPRKKQDKGGGRNSRMYPDQVHSNNRSNCTTVGGSPHTSDDNSSTPLCDISIDRPGVSYHDCLIVNELIRTSPVKDKYERLAAFQADDYKTEHVDYMFYIMEVRRRQYPENK